MGVRSYCQEVALAPRGKPSFGLGHEHPLDIADLTTVFGRDLEIS